MAQLVVHSDRWNGYLPIDGIIPSYWKAQQIILCEPIFELNPEGPDFYFDKGIRYYEEGNIEAFIARLVNGEENKRLKNDPPRPVMTIEDAHWDIPVFKLCYVVIRLTPTWDWKFRVNNPSISTKNGKLQDYYAELVHRDKDGAVLDDPRLHDNCVITHFAVTKIRNKEDADGFNIHVDFAEPGRPGASKRMAVIFDPDIQSRGGQGLYLGVAGDPLAGRPV